MTDNEDREEAGAQEEPVRIRLLKDYDGYTTGSTIYLDRELAEQWIAAGVAIEVGEEDAS